MAAPPAPTASPGPYAGASRAAYALIGLAALVLVLESASPQPQIDDSFISYRYADHLMAGQGLVWNPGERVEAITNLLWVLLVAALGAAGVAAPVAGHVLGVVCGVALLLATGALAIAGVPARVRPIAALAPWVVLASPALPYYATSGMETHGFLALTIGALAAHAHRRMPLATALLCLAIAIRPDAGIIAAAVLGTHLLEAGPGRLRSWAPAAAFAATVAALTTFRLLYYGSPVPNTFHAKVGGVPASLAVDAARVFLFEGPVWLVVPALLAARGGLRMLAPLAASVATLSYVIASGGTAMTFSRFLLPLLPILAALAMHTAACSLAARERLAPLWIACGVAAGAGHLGGAPALAGALAVGALAAAMPPSLTLRLQERPLRRGLAMTAIALLGASLAGPLGDGPSRGTRVAAKREFDRRLHDGAIATLQRLRAARIPPDALVGASAIGVVGYYGPYRILDLLGLADPVIARGSDRVEGAVIVGQGHLRSDAGYVLERRPAVLLIGRRGAPETRALTAVRALWEHPELERRYRWDPRLQAYRLRRPGR